MEEIREKLQNMLNEIDTIKIKKAQNDGEIKSNFSTMEKDFNVSDLSSGETELKKMRSQQLKTRKEITDLNEILMSEYGEL